MSSSIAITDLIVTRAISAIAELLVIFLCYHVLHYYCVWLCNLWCTYYYLATLSVRVYIRTLAVVCYLVSKSSLAAGFGRHGMPPPVCNLDLWPFDLETGVRVAYKVGNLHTKFGHTRPLGSLLDVRDGRTDKTDRRIDGRTKATLIAPSLRSGA